MFLRSIVKLTKLVYICNNLFVLYYCICRKYTRCFTVYCFLLNWDIKAIQVPAYSKDGNLGREQITFKTQRFLIVFYELRCPWYIPIYSVPCDQTTYVKKVICLKPVDRKWGWIDPFFDHETKSYPCLSSHIFSPLRATWPGGGFESCPPKPSKHVTLLPVVSTRETAWVH